MEFFTIGVYNSTEEGFFNKLKENCIDTFCDIRQRRGVRGAKYAFVNSTRLQEKLDSLNIKHNLNDSPSKLAPTNAIRELQKMADIQQGTLKRDRNKLGPDFINAYKDKILNQFNFDIFIEKLEDLGASRVVLFCVEEKPEACHRSIVADKLGKLGYKITHL